MEELDMLAVFLLEVPEGRDQWKLCQYYFAIGCLIYIK